MNRTGYDGRIGRHAPTTNSIRSDTVSSRYGSTHTLSLSLCVSLLTVDAFFLVLVCQLRKLCFPVRRLNAEDNSERDRVKGACVCVMECVKSFRLARFSLTHHLTAPIDLPGSCRLKCARFRCGLPDGSDLTPHLAAPFSKRWKKRFLLNEEEGIRCSPDGRQPQSFPTSSFCSLENKKTQPKWNGLRCGDGWMRSVVTDCVPFGSQLPSKESTSSNNCHQI